MATTKDTFLTNIISIAKGDGYPRTMGEACKSNQDCYTTRCEMNGKSGKCVQETQESDPPGGMIYKTSVCFNKKPYILKIPKLNWG